MHCEHALCSRDFKIAAPSPQQVLRQGLGSLSKSLLHLTLSPALVTCGERCPEEESSQRLGGLVQVTQLECIRTGLEPGPPEIPWDALLYICTESVSL